MADPIFPSLTTEPGDISQLAYDRLSERFPGWQAAEGNFETIFVEALSLIVAELMDVASDVPVAIYKHFGQVLLGVNQDPEATAGADSTWTMIDTLGHTVPAGTYVGLRDANGDLIAFQTVNAFTVAPGSSVAAGVALTAATPGESSNGLSGAVELIDALDYVLSVVLAAPTSEGADAESDDAYLAKLTDELSLLTPAPIRPNDFSVLYRTRVSGVARALTIDNYNPADGTTNNERMVTIYGIDEAGLDVSAGIKTAAKTLLESLREETFVVNTDSPTYTAINVYVSGHCVAGFDAATVQANVVAALTAYLSPANAGHVGNLNVTLQDDWTNVVKIRLYEVAEVINRVDGFDYIDTIWIGPGTSFAVTAATTDIFTATAHGLVLNQPVIFSALTGGAGIVAGTTYYARDITANTFKVAATPGGAAVDVTSAMTAGTAKPYVAADITPTGKVPLPTPGTITAAIVAP